MIRNSKITVKDNWLLPAIACYCCLCTSVESLIGQILAVLDETNQTNNTLIIFCLDHGKCLGQRGRWGKSVLYDESTRVPIIMAGPGVKSGQLSDVPTTLLDIAPTILDALGIDIPENFVGELLLKLQNSTKSENRLFFSEYHAVAFPSDAFMITDGRCKFHEYVDYPPELFDLENDPMEVNNLAGRLEFEAELERLCQGLYDFCDPAEIDSRAKTDQNKLADQYGGREAALNVGPPGATPVAT